MENDTTIWQQPVRGGYPGPDFPARPGLERGFPLHGQNEVDR